MPKKKGEALNQVACSDGVGVSGRVSYGVLLYGFAVKMGCRLQGRTCSFIGRCRIGTTMATSKTGSFYLTESVALASSSVDGSRVLGTVDLSAYVNVPTGQAIAIEQVDFIVQNGNNYDSNVEGLVAANGSIGFQLTDLSPGSQFVRADNHSLVASGSLNIDQANNIASHSNDFYPDNFGPAALSEAFMVVNDSLFLQAGVDGTALGGATVYVTARIRCRVVKLSTKDWMAIAIQSTAES